MLFFMDGLTRSPECVSVPGMGDIRLLRLLALETKEGDLTFCIALAIDPDTIVPAKA